MNAALQLLQFHFVDGCLIKINLTIIIIIMTIYLAPWRSHTVTRAPHKQLTIK